MIDLRIPYGRPIILSDPSLDFDGVNLGDILSKKDSELAFPDYACIFQPYCSAGTYQESVYFLPFALEYIANRRADAESLLDSLIKWISNNISELLNDNLTDAIYRILEDIFYAITKNYNLKMNSDHYQYPDGSDIIIIILKYGNLFFDGFGDYLLNKYITDIKIYENAAWFLYLLEMFYSSDIKPKESLRHSIVLSEWAKDNHRKECAYLTVLTNAVENNSLLQYWEKILYRVGIY